MHPILLALYLYVLALGVALAICVIYALGVIIDRTLELLDTPSLPSPPALPRATASFHPGELR